MVLSETSKSLIEKDIEKDIEHTIGKHTNTEIDKENDKSKDKNKDIETQTPEEKASREERRTTGKIVAVIVALLIIFLALYHAVIRKTAVLAGVILPFLIMVLYTAWVLYSTKKDKYRKLLLAQERMSRETTSTDVITQSNTELNDLSKDKIVKAIKSNKCSEIININVKQDELPVLHKKIVKNDHHTVHHPHSAHPHPPIEMKKNILVTKSKEITTNEKNQKLNDIEENTNNNNKHKKHNKKHKRPMQHYISFNREKQRFNRSFSVV